MPKIAYSENCFRNSTLEIINQANEIIQEYQAEGLDLTLRQLYYQFVSRALLPNKQSEYKRLGAIIGDGRMAGLIDWDAIVDRTRHLNTNTHWNGPQEIIEACASSFRLDRWAKQPERVEVWIEKDALIGVISRICEDLDVPYFACKGYNSLSEMWRAGRRIRAAAKNRYQGYVILHLGDHDPSGIDMTRDIQERLTTFTGHYVELERLALNYDQVEQYNPPPNPTKLSDTRAPSYIHKHGHDSWELDALDPRVIRNLVEKAILEHRDADLWEQTIEDENLYIKQLQMVKENWKQIVHKGGE